MHAAKVAGIAAAVVMACYVLGAVALNLLVAHRLTTEADVRIAAQLRVDRTLVLPPPGATAAKASGEGDDLDDAPLFLWRVAPSGATLASTPDAPPLPVRTWTSRPVTQAVDGTTFRLGVVRSGKGWLVAGQSIAEIGRVQGVLLFPEVVFGIILAVATLSGALIVGLRASAPLDVIRRRQAEFTADASHELRTPLSVVEAEVDLALRRRRKPEEYEAVLHRIAGEGRRLRTIVEDLLWLARADSVPVEPGAKMADLAAVVEGCVDRFNPVAERRGITLVRREGPAEPGLVHAAPEWIDRLAGVLVDNATKYAGAGGRVEVQVCASGSRVGLRVDDSGPGIPPEERAAVLDRFHRATESQHGSGLGLAIADSVVRMTNGNWVIAGAPLGGARMEVWWRRAAGRRIPPAPTDRPIRLERRARDLGGTDPASAGSDRLPDGAEIGDLSKH